jgi:peptide-methionine (S)-S-oxide reductase
VQSGYIGGQTPNPDYRSVCSATPAMPSSTDRFDPAIISYRQLLQVFFATDPTTLNRQGHDVGSQYRSAIFYHDAEQLDGQSRDGRTGAARHFCRAHRHHTGAGQPVYPAEDYHQDYFARNAGQPYCQAVIQPKQLKLASVVANWLKPE